MSSVPDSTAPTSIIDRIARYVWPALVIAGLAIVGSSQATWGYSEDGAQVQVSGLGGVNARAAATADVEAAFADHTQRPGLLTLALGAVIFVVAVVAWWKPIRRNRGAVFVAAAVIAAAGVGTAVAAVTVVSDPAASLFDDAVTGALDLPGPILQPGWGLLATVVVGVLTVVFALAAAVLRWWTDSAGKAARAHQ